MARMKCQLIVLTGADLRSAACLGALVVKLRLSISRGCCKFVTLGVRGFSVRRAHVRRSEAPSQRHPADIARLTTRLADPSTKPPTPVLPRGASVRECQTRGRPMAGMI